MFRIFFGLNLRNLALFWFSHDVRALSLCAVVFKMRLKFISFYFPDCVAFVFFFFLCSILTHADAELFVLLVFFVAFFACIAQLPPILRFRAPLILKQN